MLIVASAFADGLFGWPPFEDALDGAQVASSVAAGLAMGWYFGSAAMFGFGTIVLNQTFRRIRRQPIQVGPLWVIAIVYLVFDIGAYVWRDFNPHFLLFVATGVLVALFIHLASRHATNAHAA